MPVGTPDSQRLPSWGCYTTCLWEDSWENTVLQREEQQLSSWAPSEDPLPVFCVCLSPGQGFLPTRQLLLLLQFLNKLQFSFVMVTMFISIKSTYSKSILCLGLLFSFFDPKVPASTISVVWIWVISEIFSDLPWWVSGKESTCQYRRHGFGPWSGKIPRSVEQLSPRDTTIEPVL